MLYCPQMVTVSNKKRAPRIRGICAAARDLNVTRQHLALVIHGKRQSPDLLKRYQANQSASATAKGGQS